MTGYQRKSHIMSATDRGRNGRVLLTAKCILFPDNLARKTYVTVTLKGRCPDTFNIMQFVSNCLDWVADESDAFGFTRSHKCDNLKITITDKDFAK